MPDTKPEAAAPPQQYRIARWAGGGSHRSDVIAAALAVLVREFSASGMSRENAVAALRDAPDRIDAALTGGADAMVIFRLDGAQPSSVVSADQARLERFVDAAFKARASIVGINPSHIAALACHAPVAAAVPGVDHAATVH